MAFGVRTQDEAVQKASSARVRLSEERQLLTRRIQSYANRLQTLQTAWRTFAGEVEWSEKVLADRSADLRKEYDLLQKAAGYVGEAQALLKQFSDVQALQGLQAQRGPIAARRERLLRYSQAAASVRAAYKQTREQQMRQQMTDFIRVIVALFTRMQANLVYNEITLGEGGSLSWRAEAEGVGFNPEATFSQGQRQDFALSVFLARARGLGGTFFLDEPLAHLDDLNRVALLDVFRAVSLETGRSASFLLTTANKSIVRHFEEKFSRVGTALQGEEGLQPLKVVELEGGPISGVRIVEAPAQS